MRTLLVFFTLLIAFSVNAKGLQLKVLLTGIDEKIVETITPNIMIYKAQTEDKLTDTRIYNLHETAPAEIIAALQGLGFYHAIVTAKVEPSPTSWRISYHINLGKATKLTKVTLKINGPVTKLSTFTPPKLKKLIHENVITHDDYETSKQVVLEELQAAGFLRAKLTTNELLINRDTYTAEVKLIADSGPRYVFGDVTFVDPPYDVNFLQRFITFKPGDPYTKDTLLALQKHFNAADMFSKVRIVPEPDLSENPNLEVPLKIRLYLKNTNKYGASIGYGTDTGPRVSVNWQHRRKSTAGHKVNTGARVSSYRKHAYLDYVVPGTQPGYDKYIATAKLFEDDIRDEYGRHGIVGLTKVKKREQFEQHYGLRYFTESYRFSKTDKLANAQYVMPHLRLLYTHKYPQPAWCCGFKVEFDLRGTYKGALSDMSMLQGELAAKWLVPVTDMTRLVLYGKGGTTLIKNTDDIPRTRRYFSGGDKTVRGFAYRSLGPTKTARDGKSVVVGGKHMLSFTAELEQKFSEELSGAIFYDAGNAMNKWSAPLAEGGGVGFRWATPVGSFHLDIAKQLSHKQNKNLRLHLTFGRDL